MKHLFYDKYPSIRRLALDSGVAYSSVYKIAHCEVGVEDCQLGTIQKLAKALNVGLDEFYNSYANRTLLVPHFVLARESALKALGLFSGYYGRFPDTVFAEEKIPGANTILVDHIDEIPCVVTSAGYCAVLPFVINDCLRNYDEIDEDAFLEALNDYYYSHGNSWSGLGITDNNLMLFEAISKKAIMSLSS